MEDLVQLSDTEILLGFAASCIEGLARKWNIPYQEVYARMKRVGLIENYILPYYDVLHTESREQVTENIAESLLAWEQKQKQ